VARPNTAFSFFYDEDGVDFTWWRVEGLQMRFCLRSESNLLVGLRSENFKRATVDCAEGRYTFETVASLTGQHIEITRADQRRPFAIYRPGWNGGRLTLDEIHWFEWKPEKIWSMAWTWRIPSGAKVLTMRSPKQAKSVARVTIVRGARNLPEIGVLSALGWLLVAQMGGHVTTLTF
jgi:hypothetical protein